MFSSRRRRLPGNMTAAFIYLFIYFFFLTAAFRKPEGWPWERGRGLKAEWRSGKCGLWIQEPSNEFFTLRFTRPALLGHLIS